MRHSAPLDRDRDPGPGIAVASFAHDYGAGARVAEHVHASDQLMCATQGVLEVVAGRSAWLIPPQFAVWIPARTPHRIRMASRVSMRTLYFRTGVARAMPRTCTALAVGPLLRELIVEAVGLGTLSMRASLPAALRVLILEQLRKAPPVPTMTTLPRDPRALRVAQAFIDAPGNRERVADLCRRCAVTPRTIQRLFVRDVGMSFEAWRRQARLMKGVELLMHGYSVAAVAASVGYHQPNAFITLFRQTLGTTPAAWASARAAGPR